MTTLSNLMDNLTGRDLKRLAGAFAVAKGRVNELPSFDAILADAKRAFASGKSPLDALTAPVRRAVDLIREIVAEQHGQAYADELLEKIAPRSEAS